MPAFQVFGIAYKSVVFIGAVTTIYAVTYDNHSAVFATNLMFFVDMKS
jgi:type IV secretory pathway VirB3-like protein